MIWPMTYARSILALARKLGFHKELKDHLIRLTLGL